MDAVVFAALIWQFIDFAREVANLPASRSAVLTQLTAWGGGMGAVAVGAHAKATAAIVLPGSATPLGELDFWSVVLVGLLASSVASTGVDVKKAIDRSDSSKVPPLVKPPVVATDTPAQ